MNNTPVSVGKKHRITLELDDDQLSELMTQLEASLECAPGLRRRLPSPGTLADVATGLMQSIEGNPSGQAAPSHYTALLLVPIYAKLLPAWRQAQPRREIRSWAASEMPDQIEPKHIQHARALLKEAGITPSGKSAYTPQQANPEFEAALAKLTKQMARRDTLANQLLEAEATGAAPHRLAQLRDEYRRAVAAASRGVKVKNSNKILHAA